MADIFGSQIAIGDAWKLDGAIITIEKAPDLIVTGCVLNYARQVAEFLPLNKSSRYFLAGMGSGSVELSSILGPSDGVKIFIDSFSDVCKLSQNTMTIKPLGIASCEGTGRKENLSFTCTGCLLTAINVQVTNQNGMSLVSGTLGLKVNSIEVTSVG